MENSKCKICEHGTLLFFRKPVLKRYNVEYFKCSHCGFIQTEHPYWLKEAYANAITSLDLGYASRNLMLRDMVVSVIRKMFNKQGMYLDYGGGYGLFTRLMRDSGFKFFRQDLYCENIFAQHFDVEDIVTSPKKFELLTTFEVFEHLADPLAEVKKMLLYSPSILLSTELVPANFNATSNWYYLSPETGQHICFYTKKSLRILAEIFNVHLYSDNKNFHLLTPKKLNKVLIPYISYKHRITNRLLGKYLDCRHSLLKQDVEHVKNVV